jgi:hypothetical protein
MERRAFIIGSVATSIAFSAGCLGYTIEGEEDVQQREDRISELEEELESVRSERDGLAEERDNLLEELDTTNRENLVTIYELSESAYTQAESDLNDGTDFYEQEDYRTASVRYAYAQQAYQEAAIMLDEIVDPAREQSTEASAVVEESREYCTTTATIALRLVDSAYYASLDQLEQAREEVDAANRISGRLTENFQSTSTFEQSLE